MEETARPLPLPDGTLLERYRHSGAYTDCFAVDLNNAVSLADFVYAFYTSPLFKMERFILKWIVAKPSADADAAALASGKIDTFAAWTVEGRTHDQILLCDYQKRTRSWLMALPLNDRTRTRLFFGTAVAPLRPDGSRDRAFGLGFKLLLGFHKIYARKLLMAAVARV